MEIRFPKLTGYQQEVYDWLGDSYQSGKIAVIKSCRQSGKSAFCLVELICMAMQHPKTLSAVIEPTLEQSRNFYKNIVKMLDGKGLIESCNAQTLNIEFTNGSSILFRSTQQGDANRGYTVTGLLILDECAYLDNEAIFTILPLVNAHNAPIIIASTPFIREGYYYDMYLLGSERNERVKTFDWAKHKEISRFLTKETKALYKKTMSPQKYKTEVEGDFLSDEGLLFKGLDKCIGLPDDGSDLFIGIDFGSGKEGDYTVLIGLNEWGQMVVFERINNISPMEQVDWLFELIIKLSNKYNIKNILGETNSLGVVYVDALNKKLSDSYLFITEWITSNSSKREIIETLQIAFENECVRIFDNPILLNELRRYEMEINPRTKTITYNGHGAHDDTVMALAFAYDAYKNNINGFEIDFA